ncbi:hypothetical protein GCM10011404_28730 [Sphingomonas prati]|nr:hypothetical protein GCM10011404_28730 [Sphingomonas prati]
MLRMRGSQALEKGAFADAVTAFDTALQVEAGHSYALANRAYARFMLGDDAGALADTADAIKANRTALGPYGLRVQIAHEQGRTDAVMAEMAALVAAAPSEPATQIWIAGLYRNVDRPIDALRVYDRAIALKPTATLHAARYRARPKADRAGRQADLDAIARLSPKSDFDDSERARMLDETGNHVGAIALYTRTLATHADKQGWLTRRGISHATAGETALAAADFMQARKLAKDANRLNNLCWEKAVSGVALETALSECDAALRLEPTDAAIWDSRGLVLLRLGRWTDAISAYDRALALSPWLANARYGRAIVRARMGDKVRAEADASAARRSSFDITKAYSDMGLTL